MTYPNARLLPAAARWGHGIIEFQTDPVTHVLYRGTCTQTALLTAIRSLQGPPPTPTDLCALTRGMIARGWAQPNGATTLAHVAAIARETAGISVATEWDYAEPFPYGWVAYLRQYAGLRPIVIQVAWGQRLRDALDGSQPEAAAHGLRYHAIAILGKCDAGYIVADGDNLEITTRFAVYSRQTLIAAQPCSLLALETARPPARPAIPTKPAPPPVIPPQSVREHAALVQIQQMAQTALKG